LIVVAAEVVVAHLLVAHPWSSSSPSLSSSLSSPLRRHRQRNRRLVVFVAFDLFVLVVVVVVAAPLRMRLHPRLGEPPNAPDLRRDLQEDAAVLHDEWEGRVQQQVAACSPKAAAKAAGCRASALNRCAREDRLCHLVKGVGSG
jgi:hypothetical protein